MNVFAAIIFYSSYFRSYYVMDRLLAMRAQDADDLLFILSTCVFYEINFRTPQSDRSSPDTANTAGCSCVKVDKHSALRQSHVEGDRFRYMAQAGETEWWNKQCKYGGPRGSRK